MRSFRQSEVKGFMVCPREWYLKYHLGLNRVPQEEDAEERSIRDVGTLFAKGQELLYTGDDWTGVFDGKEPSKDDKDEFLAWRMLEGYVEWIEETGSDAGWQIIATERTLTIPFGSILGEEVEVSGRLDMEILDAWGLPKIVDGKTVQTFDQANQLFLDFQGRTYSLGRRIEGAPVEGFIHNQARRVLRSGTAKPPFYSRVEVRYSDRVLDNHERHMRKILTEMVKTAQALDAGGDHHDLAVPVPSRDCGWRCDFLSACGMMDDGSDYQGYLDEFFAASSEMVQTPVTLSKRKEGDV